MDSGVNGAENNDVEKRRQQVASEKERGEKLRELLAQVGPALSELMHPGDEYTLEFTIQPALLLPGQHPKVHRLVLFKPANAWSLKGKLQ